MSKDTEAMREEIMESKVLWYPDSKKNTQMDRFRTQVNRDFGLNLGEWPVPDGWAHVGVPLREINQQASLTA